MATHIDFSEWVLAIDDTVSVVFIYSLFLGLICHLTYFQELTQVTNVYSVSLIGNIGEYMSM